MIYCLFHKTHCVHFTQLNFCILSIFAFNPFVKKLLMKKFAPKLAALVATLMLAICMFVSWNGRQKNVLPKEVYDHSSVIETADGYAFRDLNKNGKMDVYEDAKQ